MRLLLCVCGNLNQYSYIVDFVGCTATAPPPLRLKFKTCTYKTPVKPPPPSSAKRFRRQLN